MENRSDNIFDEKLRQMLSGAEEMPPESVWNGIVSAMETGTAPMGSGKGSGHGIVMLSALGLVSAAAAVAAFFLLHHPESDRNTEMPAPVPVLAEMVEMPSVSAVPAEMTVSEPRQSTVPSREPEAGVEISDTLTNVVKTSLPAILSEEEVTAEETASRDKEDRDPVDILNSGSCELLAETDVWNGPAIPSSGGDTHIYELCLGGNSFVGPSQKTESIRKMSQGRFKIPSSTAVVENNDTDYYYLPMSFGVGVKFRVLKWMDIGIGVNYTLLMKRVSGIYYEYGSAGNLERICSTELKNSQHYIGVPLDIYFNIFGNEKWNTYASVGGCLEKCVSNHYSGTYDEIAINHTVFVEGIQTSVKAGLGVEYSPVKYLGIYLDPSLRYYFNNNQPRSIRTSQPLSFGVEAGLRFKL